MTRATHFTVVRDRVRLADDRHEHCDEHAHDMRLAACRDRDCVPDGRWPSRSHLPAPSSRYPRREFESMQNQGYHTELSLAQNLKNQSGGRQVLVNCGRGGTYVF